MAKFRMGGKQIAIYDYSINANTKKCDVTKREMKDVMRGCKVGYLDATASKKYPSTLHEKF